MVQIHHDGDVRIIDWEGPHDPQIPSNWPVSKKWTMFVIINLAMFAVLLNATSITSVAIEIDTTFDISEASFPNSYWTVTSWALAAAITPVFLTPVIEDFGIRMGFLITYVLFCIFLFPQAFAQNFATLIVTRAFAGGLAGTLVALIDVIVVDLFVQEAERVKAIVIYTFVLLAGYTLGPVVGGGVIRSLDWRWIFYVQLIVDFAFLPILFLATHETRAPVLLKHIVRQKRKDNVVSKACYSRDELEAHESGKSLWSNLRKALIRPARMFVTEPVLDAFTLWSAFTTGVLFTFTQSTGQVYAELYGWDEYRVGVVQVTIFIGQCAGLLACFADDVFYRRRERRRQDNMQTENASENTDTSRSGRLPLEARLYLSLPATFVGLAGGLFVYAWTSYSTLPWIAPTIGLFLVGFASMCIVTAVDIYITHFYAKYAGSAIAIVALGENVFAAFLPLCALNMYTNLGFQWASSLLGFVALGLCIVPAALIWKGADIRQRSSFVG